MQVHPETCFTFFNSLIKVATTLTATNGGLMSLYICFSQEADNDPTGEAAANTQQTLTFYELDLGLNHVVRKYSEALEEHGNFLITGTLLNMLTAMGGKQNGHFTGKLISSSHLASVYRHNTEMITTNS